MQRITSEHWVAFVAMLKEVGEATGVEMDLANIEHVLVAQMAGRFPEGQMAACTAIMDRPTVVRASASGFPLLAASCGGPQPNRPGFDKPTLSIKIVDMRRKPFEAAGGFHVPFAYDVFPDGRRILEAGGLRLDTRAGGSSYESGSIVTDTLDAVTAFPEHLAFITSTIESFPFRGDPAVDRARQAALGEFFSA